MYDYVEGILTTKNSILTYAKATMPFLFEMKDMGEAFYILGI